jgi:hypothetical protein
MTIPQTSTYDKRSATYLTFDAAVARNSAFQVLTVQELEELGGVEYRALNALVWIVGIVRYRSISFVLVEIADDS